MNRVVARKVGASLYGLKVPRKTFCNDASLKVSSSTSGGPNYWSSGDEVASPSLEKPKSLTDNDQQYDVAIVGGGMVGMALACSLASTPLTRHLNVAIIDNNPAFGKSDSMKKEGPPDSRVSTVTPATISFFKDVGAWQHVEQNRHAYFDNMQVWDYTGLGYTNYSARDVNKEFLGCVVENKVLQSSLWSSLQNTDLRKTIYPSSLTSMALQSRTSPAGVGSTSSIEGMFTRGRLAKLELSDGSSLYTKLVVGADGGKSRVRELAGFKTTGWNYSQNAIICTVEHTLENHCAWQRFLPTGPIALLPMGDKYSNIVWSMTPEEASSRKSMNGDDFVKAVNHALDYGHGPHPGSSLLGNADMFSWLSGKVRFSSRDPFRVPPKVIKLASERMVFPLSLRHVNEYSSKRVALIGDAAHTVHPLAGQGVNLGFGDACTLSKVIAEGIAVGTDIGEVSLLKNYEAERKPENIAMMAVLDGFQKAYSVDFGPLNLVRAAALHGAHYITPLKKSIISYASGEQKLPLFS